ncbi:MAG: lytic transglycosylase domain-containing protein [Rhodobacteraceae bacterium]|nr:lytic transglycosylase domain-containing protein [Paracoccaceae bacterium]
MAAIPGDAIERHCSRLILGVPPVAVAAAIWGLVAIGAPLDASAETAQQSAPPTHGPAKIVDRETAALRAAVKGNSAAASEAVKNDPLLRDLAEWGRLRKAKTPDWTALSALTLRRPDWPGTQQLRAKAENAMPESLPKRDVTAYFSKREPLTSRGARLLGEAEIASGDAIDGEARIVRAWRLFTMGQDEEEIFHAKHGALIAPYHPERARMLFWREHLSAARRLAEYLPADEQRLLAAKDALWRRKKNADQLAAAVPEALRDDPGLAYARHHWHHKRKQRQEAEAAIHQASISGALGEPERWAKRRAFYAREAYEEGRPQDAYALAAKHGVDRGVDFAEMEWFAGWIALRQLGEAQTALGHFTTLWQNVSSPISRGRAAYWAAEAAQTAGDKDLAAQWRFRASAYPNVFYGQLASDKLGVDEAEFIEDTTEPAPAKPSQIDTDLAAAADTLYRLGKTREARQFVRRLGERQTTKAGYLNAIKVARRNKDMAAEIKVAKLARDASMDLWQALYPIPESPRFTGRDAEAALLLSLARQESAFAPEARSSAGALGLVQLMPATARETARRAGLKYQRSRLTADPHYNLTLADAHVRELLESFDGSYVLSIAAYNAGSSNVRKWIKRFGDPRETQVDTVDWIESIPFSETRNYVQRVLETAQVYRARLGLTPEPVRLANDLSR